MVILVTITLSLLILELFDRVFGNQPLIVPAFISEKFSVAGIVLSFSYLIAGILSFICVGFLYFFIKKTKTGIAIEAIAQDSEAAELMGVKISSMLILASFISGGFASLAGILFSQIYSISPIWALNALLYSFVIVILGGLGNIEGSILASFIFGAILTTVTFFQGPQWSFVITFILLILILLIKPSGILGTR
jgi:branched-chain amino acid transport system permease protein